MTLTKTIEPHSFYKMTNFKRDFTPTPYYQMLLDTLSKEEIALHFLELLKKEFPVADPDVKITVTFLNTKSPGRAKEYLGIVNQNPVYKTADITVYKTATDDTQRVLDTIAHEYKHVVQAYTPGYAFWSKRGRKRDPMIEPDAHIFGIFKSKLFCFGHI